MTGRTLFVSTAVAAALNTGAFFFTRWSVVEWSRSESTLLVVSPVDVMAFGKLVTGFLAADAAAPDRSLPVWVPRLA